jgi:redox-sensitive bicupin YhaK (pirin superfamily)
MTILDVNLEEGASFAHKVPLGQTTWLLGIGGALDIRNGDAVSSVKSGASVSILAQDQTHDLIISGNSKAHFVILQAEPLREPFVQRGPFAMTTKKEVEAMFAAHAAGELGSLNEISPEFQRLNQS